MENLTKLEEHLLATIIKDPAKIERVLVELSRFFKLKFACKDYSGEILTSSTTIDAVLHEFLQFPLDYIKFCNDITTTDKVFDHSPILRPLEVREKIMFSL